MLLSDIDADTETDCSSISDKCSELGDGFGGAARTTCTRSGGGGGEGKIVTWVTTRFCTVGCVAGGKMSPPMNTEVDEDDGGGTGDTFLVMMAVPREVRDS